MKYKITYHRRQTTAMSKIPQWRQHGEQGEQGQQRRPSRPGQRRVGLVLGTAGWAGGGTAAAATVVFYS